VRRTRLAATLAVALIAFGCRTGPPVPPEAEAASALELRLWRAGASVYAAEDYGRFRERLRDARAELDRESARLGWFRDYTVARADFQKLLTSGADLLARIEKHKREQADTFGQDAVALARRIIELQETTLRLNEKGEARYVLARAELALAEVQALIAKGAFGAVPARLEFARNLIGRAETALTAFLKRYLDPAQVRIWKGWVERTIRDSSQAGLTAFVVNKIDGTMTVYRAGRPLRVFQVGLGMNGFSGKLHSGDNATPEGLYKVIKKIPRSQYYRALLINYPNDEDRARFVQAKKDGLLAPQAGIGGLIEIHGGGKDTLTRGCIALEDADMDVVYELAAVGSPVTIVGSIEADHPILAIVRKKRP
jgi:hypothetical protein